VEETEKETGPDSLAKAGDDEHAETRSLSAVKEVPTHSQPAEMRVGTDGETQANVLAIMTDYDASHGSDDVAIVKATGSVTSEEEKGGHDSRGEFREGVAVPNETSMEGLQPAEKGSGSHNAVAPFSAESVTNDDVMEYHASDTGWFEEYVMSMEPKETLLWDSEDVETSPFRFLTDTPGIVKNLETGPQRIIGREIVEDAETESFSAVREGYDNREVQDEWVAVPTVVPQSAMATSGQASSREDQPKGVAVPKAVQTDAEPPPTGGDDHWEYTSYRSPFLGLNSSASTQYSIRSTMRSSIQDSRNPAWQHPTSDLGPCCGGMY
jgi:hypothetical protein